MKIVIAVHHLPPRYTGGGEWETLRIAARLQDRGHQVRVLCVERVDAGPTSGVAWEDQVYEEIQVRRLSFDRAKVPDPFRFEYDNPWIGSHLQQFLAEERPDVFHLVSGYLITGRAIVVARELLIPTVVTLLDFWFLCRRINLLRSDGAVATLPIVTADCARCLGEERRRYRWLRRLLPEVSDAIWRLRAPKASQPFVARAAFLQQSLHQANAIISRSQFLRSVFVTAGVETNRIIFARQGKDFPNLNAVTLAKTPTSVLRIGYLGQIAWHKGVHILFEAMSHLPNARAEVHAYGDTTAYPDYVARLRRLAAKDPRLHLPGPISPDRLTVMFKDIDVMVVPSLCLENSPTVILEAFAHRTPVIAANQGGMAELVQDGQNGLLFTPGDPASLSSALQQLLTTTNLLPIFREGIGLVRGIDEDVTELEAVYRRILSDPPRLGNANAHWH